MTSTLKITFHAGAVPKDDLGGDLLSSSGLVTSSEEYYPTVAINALMRALRDPAMASHHAQVVRSLFSIFQGLRLAAVPFLPKASISPPSWLSDSLSVHQMVLSQLWCVFLRWLSSRRRLPCYDEDSLRYILMPVRQVCWPDACLTYSDAHFPKYCWPESCPSRR